MNVMLANTHPSSETEPPRMAPLARLPLFFALEGRRAVVAGGTQAAAWKAELLSAAGAERGGLGSVFCPPTLGGTGGRWRPTRRAAPSSSTAALGMLTTFAARPLPSA